MHEQSITFQLRSGEHKGKWVNTPGIYQNKPINPNVAEQLFYSGKIPPLGGLYPTVKEATSAAQIRSLLFGPDETLNYDKLQPLFEDVIRSMHPGRP